jgi:predicted acylesterase/phospholipase RssA
LVGSHAYALPLTIEQRLGDRVELARDVAASDVELVVIATDLTDDYDEEDGASLRELVYSSRTTPPDVFAEAVIASAAVSALVLPVRVGYRIATDGGWVRNFTLAYAYELPDMETIISFRYLPRYPRIGIGSLVDLGRRLHPFGRVPRCEG